MPASSLSTEAKKTFVSLQKKLRVFLKQYATLEKGGPERAKHREKYTNVKALFVELSLMDLTTPQTEAVQKVENKETALVAKKPATKKEARKDRRNKRKENRGEKREERRVNRKSVKVDRKNQKDDESGSKEEGRFRYDELMATWNNFKFDEITSQFRDYLEEAEAFLTKASNFVGYVESFAQGAFTTEVDQIKEIIEKTTKFLAIARNISSQIDRYAGLAQDIIAVTMEIPRNVGDLKDGVVETAQKVFAAAKQFIATADTSDAELMDSVEKMKAYLATAQEKLGLLENLVGIATADEDGNNLPDWYDRLSVQFEDLMGNGKDLIPGTKIDDVVLLKITSLKGSVDRFIAAASDKVEELDLQEKIKNAQQWLGELSKFVTAITGFVDNIKDGDLEGIYKDLKDFKSFIDSDKDILKGTEIDDKIKKLLKENSKKAETFLMNLATGGDPAKEGEVREILGHLDTILLSTGYTPDHMSKYEKDEDKITLPDFTAISADESKALLEKYGIKKAGSSYEGILSSMKDESDVVMGKVTTRYGDAVKRGSKASEAFVDAKKNYDKAVKGHEDYFKATNALGKKIILGLVGLAASALSPAVASIVTASASALLGDYDKINDKIRGVIPSELSFVADLATGILPSVLPRWGSEEGLIKLDGGELLKGLDELYSKGVTFRYKEVYGLLNEMKGKARVLGQNLRAIEQEESVDQDELKDIQQDVLVLAKKWEGLAKNVKTKYIDLKYPPVNKERAYWNGSRYLFAIWLIKFPQKEIRIGDSMIKNFKDFGVMSESGAKWSTGWGAKAVRSVTGFCGADPGDYRAELKKMKAWASKEADALKTSKAWAKVF